MLEKSDTEESFFRKISTYSITQTDQLCSYGSLIDYEHKIFKDFERFPVSQNRPLRGRVLFLLFRLSCSLKEAYLK